MNRLFKLFFTIALLLSGAGALQAQVTITTSDFNFESGITFTKMTSVDLIEVDLGQAGADQSWNFSALEAQFEEIENVDNAEGNPGADSFPEANRCTYAPPGPDGSQLFTYSDLNNDHFILLGTAMRARFGEMDTTLAMPIETDAPFYAFPLNYGDEWDVVVITDFMGTVIIDSMYFTVDAWGSITDAAGTFDCIRMQTYKVSTELGEEEDEVERDYEYNWIAPEFGIVVSIDSEDNADDPDFNMGDFKRTIGFDYRGIHSQDQPSVPSYSGLDPAYPNPFNAQTQLGFNLAQPGAVTITVYDINGQAVSSVVKGYFNAGSYRVGFNAADLSSGVYFAKFSTWNGIRLGCCC